MIADAHADLRDIVAEILRAGPAPASEIEARLVERLLADRVSESRWRGRERWLCTQLLNELKVAGRAEVERGQNGGARWSSTNG